jgi:hypothetical protein
MNRFSARFLTAFALIPVLAASGRLTATDLTTSLKKGKPEFKSAGPLAFGPDGVLFAADPLGAAILAIDTGDRGPRSGSALPKVEGIDSKVAALLGSSPKEIEIVDLSVNPASGNAYLSVARGRGPDSKPALVKVTGDGKLSLVGLDDVKFARAELPDAPASNSSQRGAPSRLESFTDLAFVEGRLLVAGLSNEEFSSVLRAIPFPFDAFQKGTGVEIYHGSHGRFETRSPIRTFVPYEIGGEPHLLAAYTCTPLVKIPVKELKPGIQLKGTTVAELGNQNRPLDMIVYKKDGKEYLLLANSKRGVMKISTENLDKAEPILAHVSDKKGQRFETIESWKGIYHLDRLDDGHALILRRDDAGAFHLESPQLP